MDSSHCAYLGFFLAGENTISNERVVLNGLSCQAWSSLVPGTSRRAIGEPRGETGSGPFCPHGLGGLHSVESETQGYPHTEASSAAACLLHPYAVWLPWQHCMSPLAVSAGWDFWFSQHNSLTYFWLEICSVPRGTYLGEQLLAARPAPCTSCTSPEHQMHTGALLVSMQWSEHFHYWTNFLFYLNRTTIHVLSLCQADENSTQLQFQVSLRESVLENPGLLYGGYLAVQCARCKSEMPVVRAFLHLLKNISQNF